MRQTLSTSKAPEAVGTYSQGVIHQGVYYFSGQIGIDPKNQELHEGFDDQLKQVMKNIDGLLESQGITRQNIIKTTIFLQDLRDFPKINQAYENFFQRPYPARSCVQAAALPKGALVEIEVLAAENV